MRKWMRSIASAAIGVCTFGVASVSAQEAEILSRLTPDAASLPAGCRPSPIRGTGPFAGHNPTVVTDPASIALVHMFTTGADVTAERPVAAGYAAFYREEGGSPQIGTTRCAIAGTSRLPKPTRSATTKRLARRTAAGERADRRIRLLERGAPMLPIAAVTMSSASIWRVWTSLPVDTTDWNRGLASLVTRHINSGGIRHWLAQNFGGGISISFRHELLDGVGRLRAVEQLRGRGEIRTTPGF